MNPLYLGTSLYVPTMRPDLFEIGSGGKVVAAPVTAAVAVGQAEECSSTI